jgi:hypothetical protein
MTIHEYVLAAIDEENELSRLPRLLSVQEEDFRKKISRLKQKLIPSFANQAINDKTVWQEDELSTSHFCLYVQEEEDFLTETKTNPPFVSRAINDEIMLEGNELPRRVRTMVYYSFH